MFGRFSQQLVQHLAPHQLNLRVLRAAATSSGMITVIPITTTILSLLFFASPSLAVKRGDFKTCDQSGFCKRNRALADRSVEKGDSWTSPYSIRSPSFNASAGSFTAEVGNALFPTISFSLEVRFQKDGVARILMDEVDGLRQRYNEAGMWAVQTEPILEREEGGYTLDITNERTSITYAEGRQEVIIRHSPILITFLRDGTPHIVLNQRGLFNMEHFRIKAVGGGETEGDELVIQGAHEGEDIVVVKEEAFPGFSPENEDTMWEETFGGKTDTKPKGQYFVLVT